MQCEMCGRDENLVKTLIEGTELSVCQSCAGFGKVVRIAPREVNRSRQRDYNDVAPRQRQTPAKEIAPTKYLAVVDDYADKIRLRRDHLCIKQEDLAKILCERESMIQKIESSHFKPSIELARKLESFLKIKLVEEREDEAFVAQKKDPDVITIGDLIQMKMAKNNP